MGAVGGRLFEAEFEAHHEIDPCGGILLESVEGGGGGGTIDGVLLEYLVDLFLLVVGAFDDFTLFPAAFGDVVLGVSAGGEVAPETHGDGAGSYLGQAGEDYDVGGGNGSGEAGSEGEGDGETVGEADDNVAHDGGGLEVTFYVWSLSVLRCLGGLVHDGSVVRGRGVPDEFL